MKIKQTCKNCRFNCEDDPCINDCNVGSYYAEKGLSRICYEGELWEGNTAVLSPVDYPVVWNGRQYKEIEKFDFRVVELSCELNGCDGYMTVIPISPRKRREECETKAAVLIIENLEWTLFEIYDDWGKCHEMKMHNSLNEEIEAAKNAAKEQGLLINEA